MTAARYIGWLDPGPLDPSHIHSDDLTLESDFGIAFDGLLLICPAGATINGASIPRILWPALGHPLSGRNRIWSAPHDCGYAGSAIYIDLSCHTIRLIEPDAIMRYRFKLPANAIAGRPPRAWHDRMMVAGMTALREGAIKRAACWAGVRVGGWACWRK